MKKNPNWKYTLWIFPRSPHISRGWVCRHKIVIFLLENLQRNEYLTGKYFLRWFRNAIGSIFPPQNMSKYHSIVWSHFWCLDCKTQLKQAYGRKCYIFFIDNVSWNGNKDWGFEPTNQKRGFDWLVMKKNWIDLVKIWNNLNSTDSEGLRKISHQPPAF